MIRITKIINREDLFSLLKDPNVAKIELGNADNSLGNQKVCRIKVYLRLGDISSDNKSTKENKCVFGELVGNIKVFSKLESMDKSDSQFLRGLGNLKSAGFIKVSHLEKIANMIQKYGYSDFIPSRSIELITKYI